MKKFSMESLREGFLERERRTAHAVFYGKESQVWNGKILEHNARKGNKIKLDAIQTSGFGPSMLTV